MQKKKLKKIRPHRKCPCGSKKKYRNCCGKQNTTKFNDLPKATQESFRELQLKHKMGSWYHENRLGYTPGIVSAIFDGRRLVGLGGSLVQSDNPDKDWSEPSEFLTSHLKTTLGNDWFDQEQQKCDTDRHIILNWALSGSYEVLDPANPVDSRKLNGSALAYLHLAYDLFVLHNKSHVTEKLISRLKSKEGFNGARYELFVLATMIRAGFELDPFDETLGAGKVTECKATHIQTGITVEVEAKTRNVKNVMGAVEGNSKKVRLYDKLKDAIKKGAKKPYIIFIDLNFPEVDVYEDNEKLLKVRKEHEKLVANHPNDLPNIIIYTNIPFHYARDDGGAVNTAFGVLKIIKPKIKLKNEDKIIDAIKKSLDQYKYLPREFSESKKFAEDVVKKLNNRPDKS